MGDPWAFGWTQVFTIFGFLVTIAIAIGGFRTFNRWKREKIEEKRIDTAIDALQYAYESKFVFAIRAAIAYPYEWEKMPETVEVACRPVVDREFGRAKKKS